MGQENSHEQIDPQTPPFTLAARTLEAVADYMKDEGGRPKRIVVMTGAGISTSAGIPDFRSPDTGLYANLARLDLPYAEAVFDISYFRQNPDPFYMLAKELYPGKFYPTIAHAFIALLDEKYMLQMLFTQNIDCLERRAGVPAEKIVEAHGSFATQRCIDCKTAYPDDLMKKAVSAGEVPHCIVPQCNGLVKPDIVFFGEALPEAFFAKRHVPTLADMVIIMGTSLSVQPFASLPSLAKEGCPRVLFNLERVGDLGSRPDDVVVLGDCDTGVRKLAEALGWLDELELLWREVGGNIQEKEALRLREERKGMTKDEILEAEIGRLTGEIDTALKLSKDHTARVNDHLDTDSNIARISSTPSISGLDPSLGEADLKEIAPTPSAMGSEGGLKEPPSTPANGENQSSNIARFTATAEAQGLVVGSEKVLDVTLPHNKPNSDAD
jgi:NAD+-dependent protein deacetylase SIR2